MAVFNWDGTEKVMEDQRCHTVTLTDDVIQNPMLFENNNVHGLKKTNLLKFSKVSAFNSKIPVQASIFTISKLYKVDPNDELYPLV